MGFDPVSYLLGKQAGGGGGGGGATVEPLSVTENGTYTAPSGKAYSPVNVNVSSEPDMTVTAKQFKLLINYDDYYGPYLMNFGQTVASGCTIDWGDGTTETSRESTAEWNDPPYSHQYATPGHYVITVTANEGVLSIIGRHSHGSGLGISPYGVANSVQSEVTARGIHAMIVRVAIGEDVVINDNGLRNMPFLKSNRLLGQITGGVLPSTCSYSEIFEDLIIPDGTVAIVSDGFSTTMAKTVVVPYTIRDIRTRAFDKMYATTLYDFTAIDLIDGDFPVTLANTNSIYCRNSAPLTSILFKSKEVADAAKAATNWSNFAAYIHYVGEE